MRYFSHTHTHTKKRNPMYHTHTNYSIVFYFQLKIKNIELDEIKKMTRRGLHIELFNII